MRYERVTFSPAGGPSRSAFLRDPAVIDFMGEPALRGVEVNRLGDEVATGGADERVRIIPLSAVTRRTRMRMDRHYAELTEAD